jgi:hypothetical protein
MVAIGVMLTSLTAIAVRAWLERGARPVTKPAPRRLPGSLSPAAKK